MKQTENASRVFSILPVIFQSTESPVLSSRKWNKAIGLFPSTYLKRISLMGNHSTLKIQSSLFWQTIMVRKIVSLVIHSTRLNRWQVKESVKGSFPSILLKTTTYSNRQPQRDCRNLTGPSNLLACGKWTSTETSNQKQPQTITTTGSRHFTEPSHHWGPEWWI